MNSETDPLAAEFPAATREQWLKLVEGALKGAPFEKKLVGKTYDGLASSRSTRARPPRSRSPARRPARLDDRAARRPSRSGGRQCGRRCTISRTAPPARAGVRRLGRRLWLRPDASEATIARALDGVYLDAGIALELDLGPQTKDAATRLAALVKRRGIAPAATNIRFGFDPIGAAAARRQPSALARPRADLQCSDRRSRRPGFRGRLRWPTAG